MWAKIRSLLPRPRSLRALSYCAFVEHADSGIVLADAVSLRVLDANPALLTRAGYAPADLNNITLSQLFSTDEHSGDTLQMQIDRMGDSATFDWFEKRVGGEPIPVEVRCRKLLIDGRELLTLLAHDVSLRRKVESQLIENQARLDHLAHHDPLTDLPNRHYLTAILPSALAEAREKGQMVAILFIDLDHFKHVNDSRGHEVGDRLLQEVARRIKAKTRDSDVVCRMGGDEFVVVLRGFTDVEHIAQTARRINGALDQPITIDGHKLVTTASIGVSLFPRDGSDIGELLKNSDSAMYQAKEAGRNKFQMFRAEMTEKIKQRVAVESALRAAIKLNQFDVLYQPIIELQTRRVACLEALLRWAHPEQGLIGPDKFIDVAEESGLIVPIGNFVIRHVLDDIAAWRALGLAPIPVSVNVSPAQLRQGDLANFIRKQLAVAGCNVDALELELTERAMFMAGNALRSEPRRDMIAELRDCGIKIAIDDFGTGYSSLSYLKRWRVDKLKIDRSFIRDLVTDPNDFAIVSAILAIARQLRIDVVAEGVEGYPQVQTLRKLGCRFGQGYLFAPPQVPERCIPMLRHSLLTDSGDLDVMADLISESGPHQISAVTRRRR
ncbi:MAG: EAL domain-containing protein [Steroidobacteraceae bacterium]|nr:EAL domain-containing protein [Steroidobacteraceae bacterium]MDW8257870.1 EAL domain-containing protein [Gammaproteobacteria bacterium]